MILDTSIQHYIDQELVKLNNEERANHTPSGKLSASMLIQPLRFQVMKSIGIPTKSIEPYVLGKFKRGNDVEDWYVSMLTKIKKDGTSIVTATQKLVEYQNAVGYVDVIAHCLLPVDFKQPIPHEVKSVTNAKLKRINKTGVDFHYRLQASFYAIALGSTHYAVDIVSAEDLRVSSYIFDVKADDMVWQVDGLIKKYNQAMQDLRENKTLPALEPHPEAKWAVNQTYSMFDQQWFSASDESIIKYMEQKNG
jgi:hypothetical protein